MKQTNCNGFTLIETLVVGILLAIMAGAGVSLLIMYMRETRESSAMQRMQRQYETFAQEVARDTRNATRVEVVGADLGGSLFAGIMLYRGSKCLGGYQVSANNLQEFDTTTAAWKDFEVGGRAVSVAPGSGFVVPALRDAVSPTLRLVMVDVDTYYLEPRKDRYTCRN